MNGPKDITSPNEVKKSQKMYMASLKSSRSFKTMFSSIIILCSSGPQGSPTTARNGGLSFSVRTALVGQVWNKAEVFFHSRCRCMVQVQSSIWYHELLAHWPCMSLDWKKTMKKLFYTCWKSWNCVGKIIWCARKSGYILFLLRGEWGMLGCFFNFWPSCDHFFT